MNEFRCPNCDRAIRWVILPGGRFHSLVCTEDALGEFLENIKKAVCPYCLEKIPIDMIKRQEEDYVSNMS